ncbi:hypothetical protein TrLO_g4811 [Triparma laevis f. longispina]|uniref:Uncharacterized protein n=1 Tax=Triparma laevis f. longispina TaxID=1714387 RepID=A0A9W7FKL9_9STRA|nr:hypothetical protein TrLO_g4811 [Triparma laevis f. longispina]
MLQPQKPRRFSIASDCPEKGKVELIIANQEDREVDVPAILRQGEDKVIRSAVFSKLIQEIDKDSKGN